jgi:hypothetical protein
MGGRQDDPSGADEELGFVELLADMESALPELNEQFRKMAGLIAAIGSEPVADAERHLESLLDVYEDQLRRVDRGMGSLIAQVEHDPNKLADIDDLAHLIHGMAMAAEHGLGEGESGAQSPGTARGTSRALRPRTTRLRNALMRAASTWHVIRNWSDRLRAVEASSGSDTHRLDGPRKGGFHPPRAPSSFAADYTADEPKPR